MHAEIIKINSNDPEPSLIAYAAEKIRQGQVLGMPTDTFYGLAADPLNLRAVDRIYDIKTRSRHKPLSLLIEGIDQAEELTRSLPDEFYALARKFWPGPLTMIVRAGSRLPLRVTANSGNVAIRVPAAKIPVEIIRLSGLPLTATAASLLGQSEPTTAEAVRDQLHDRLSVIIDGGPAPRDLYTTIVDLSGDNGDWYVQREGAIPAQEIAKALGEGAQSAD